MLSTNLIPDLAMATNSLAGSGASADPGSVLGALIRLFGAFCVVVGVFFAVVWGLRRWQNAAANRSGQPLLRIVESRGIGPRQTLHVVECGDQRFLLAGTPAGVQMLSALSPSAAVPEPASQSAPSPNPRLAPAPATSFAEAFLQAIGRAS